ncbi:MAG: hypothetical protein GC180_02850 [Bacteroidetes bacterium]|nr:hypothetical protein [Bacteroidota bacterium]
MQQHPAFEEILPFISLQAYDRKKLFKLVNEDGEVEVKPIVNIEEPLTKEPEILSESEVQEPIETIAERNSDTRFMVDFSEIEKTEEEEVPTQEGELKEIPFLLKKGDEIGPDVKDEQNAEELKEEVDTIVNEPVSLNETEDQGREEETPTVEEVEEEIEDEVEAKLETEIEDEPTGISEEPIAEDQRPEAEHTATIPSETKTDFLHWLDRITMHEPVNQNEAENQGREEEYSKIGEHEAKSNADSHEPGAESPETIQLIDKFIETNPSITRVQGNFYNPVEKARESERLDDALITETMAKIFVKQEKFERAIDAYEKLQLKYPQKSNYFAALIEELKSKID